MKIILIMCERMTLLFSYDLYASVNHFGSVGAGHYTAHVRKDASSTVDKDDVDPLKSPSRRPVWLYCNDSDVGQSANAPGETDDERRAAYVLFYQRKGKDTNNRKFL